MNYIEQINRFWLAQDEHQFTTTEIALYFNLLKICNSLRWANPFKRNSSKITADLGISKSTLEKSRNRLKQAGIIDFKSINGSANVTYLLADLTKIYAGNNAAADAGYNATTEGALAPNYNALKVNKNQTTINQTNWQQSQKTESKAVFEKKEKSCAKKEKKPDSRFAEADNNHNRFMAKFRKDGDS